MELRVSVEKEWMKKVGKRPHPHPPLSCYHGQSVQSIELCETIINKINELKKKKYRASLHLS